MGSTIEPFVEAPTVRTTTQPASGGIDLSAIEHVIQGHAVTDIKKRSKGILPRMNSGRVDHVIEELNFGQSKTFDDGLPFVDTQQKIDAQKYIENSSQFDGITVGEFFEKDGAIEPLFIRDVINFVNVEVPFISHIVRGTLEDGNEDILRHTDRKLQFVEIADPSVVEPFLDSQEHFGVDLAGSINMPGFVADERRVISPFDESTAGSGSLVPNGDTLTETGDLSSINAALQAMTGPIDDDIRPRGFKSAAAGFIYSNNNTLGTDSIAFGGLLKG